MKKISQLKKINGIRYESWGLGMLITNQNNNEYNFLKKAFQKQN